MWRRAYGFTRRDLRGGSGTDVDAEHYDEVLGSSEFYIYIPPAGKLKGYEELRAFLRSEGCLVEYPGHSDLAPNKNYQVVAITQSGHLLADTALRRAHRWAHQRNFLHSFFQPLSPQNPAP
ncbi:MAG: hypothetical protein HYY05_04040 [Chloroflexi bacterium]|nr:hypothetical protein [Chloroflexota bacterium]